MAKPEHVDLVQEGSDATARFAREHPGVPLDLSEANLEGCNLTEASLAGANFAGAVLRNGGLMAADLTGACLCDADLRGVSLHRARMQGADLRGAKLGEIGVGRQLMCVSANSFEGVRWDRERLEEILAVLNLNRDWEIRYEIVPRQPEG
jgi:uncharacterized protein YjbI with pentapeptide repeats